MPVHVSSSFKRSTMDARRFALAGSNGRIAAVKRLARRASHVSHRVNWCFAHPVAPRPGVQRIRPGRADLELALASEKVSPVK